MQTTQPAAAVERIRVGMFDATTPQSLILISGTSRKPSQSIFGLKILVYRHRERVEEIPRRILPGPQAVDGSFGSIAWYSSFDDRTPITLTWYRPQPHLLAARITAPSSVRVAIEASRPWPEDRQWSNFQADQDRTTLRGEQIQPGSPALPRSRFLVRTDRTAIGAAGYASHTALRQMLASDGHAQESENLPDARPRSLAALSFDLSQQEAISLVATVGNQWGTMEQETRSLLQKPIVELLETAAKKEADSGPRSNGAIGESLNLVSRHLAWNRFYDPERRLIWFAPRRWSGEQPDSTPPPPRISIESLLMATMSAVIDPESSKSTVSMLLDGQLTDGRVPPWRQANGHGPASMPAGRSMLPIGSYCVLKIYLATDDLEFLAWAYPRLQLWNDWWYFNRGDGQAWRDGNGDGLLEWGFNDHLELGSLGERQLTPKDQLAIATTESHPGNLPITEATFNEKTGTVELNSAGLSSLYALDTESLATIARELGLAIEADRLYDRYQRLRTLINDKLWDEQRGVYADRHWDNRISPSLRVDHFYALIAGIPERARAERMIALLRDEQRLGSAYPIPSLARDAPGFDAVTPGRGAIDALANYLIYLGLRRYQRHEEAAKVARSGLSLGRAAIEKGAGPVDSYSALDGSAIRGGTVAGAGSGLIFWPAIEEIFCIDPLSGINIGSLINREEARLEQLFPGEKRLDVLVGPNRTVLRRGGRIEIEGEAPIRLQSYRRQERALSFIIETSGAVRLLSPGEEGRKITVSVDNQILGSTSVGASVSFQVPAGTHRILLVR